MRLTTIKSTIGIVFLGVSAVTLLGGWLFRCDLNLARTAPHPVIDVVRYVELGEHELNTIVEPLVVVRNRGRQPLILDQFTTSCGCLGVFAELETGQREKLGRLEIPARQQATLVVRLTVTGRIKAREVKRIRFATNDPQNPTVELAIGAIPIARYFACPATVALGTLPVGDRQEREVEITALERGLPAIRCAVSSSEHIRVEYQKVTGSPHKAPGATTSEPVGRLRISFEGSAVPGEIEGIVSLFTEGRQEPALVIPVNGRVAHNVELLPRELKIPRVSSSGPVYAASCICRVPSPKSLSLAIQESPPYVEIQIKDVPGNPSMKLIQVDAAALHNKIPAGGLETVITLIAEIESERTPLSLKLTVQQR